VVLCFPLPAEMLVLLLTCCLGTRLYYATLLLLEQASHTFCGQDPVSFAHLGLICIQNTMGKKRQFKNTSSTFLKNYLSFYYWGNKVYHHMYVKELKGLHSEFEGLLPQMNND
jgi:hypothetical protein